MCDNAYVPKEKPTEKKVTSATEVEEEDPVEAINAEIEWRCLLCETVNDLSEEGNLSFPCSAFFVFASDNCCWRL